MISQRDLGEAFEGDVVRYPEDCQYTIRVASDMGEDCQYIIRVASDMGLDITMGQAQEIWDAWSDLYAAGWLGIHCDEEVRAAIKSFARTCVSNSSCIPDDVDHF